MPSEGVSGVYPGEQAAFALERIAEHEASRDRDIDFQFFLDIDAEAPAAVVLRRSVPHGVRGEERTVIGAEAVLAFVAGIHFAFRIKYRFLTADADNEPIPPDVAFNTEAHHSADVLAFVPDFVFHARSLDIVSAHRRNELAVDGVKGEKRTRIA